MKSGLVPLFFVLLMLFPALSAAFPASGTVGSQDGGFSNADQLISAVMKRAGEASSLSCRFVQEKHMSMLAQPVVFTGRMNVRRPDRLRWEFTSPVPSIFIIDGAKIKRCTPSTRPVEFDMNSNPALKQAAVQMLAWVSGNFRGIQGMFSITLAKRGTGLVMEPRDPVCGAGISRITVMFNPDTLRPATVQIDEQGGDWTRISLSGYRINPNLSDNIFESCSF